MTADETLTPLGELLERARGSTSKRQASRLAGISEGRWRQVVTGQQKAGGGIVVPANPRRETVIAMATAVGADVDEALRRAGMTPRERVEPAATDDRDAVISDVAGAILRDTELLEEAKEHLLKQYQLLRRLPPQKTSPTSTDAQEPPGPAVPPPDHTEGAREGVRRIRDETRRAHGIEEERKHKRGTGTRDS
jgi:hypothetical protein